MSPPNATTPAPFPDTSLAIYPAAPGQALLTWRVCAGLHSARVHVRDATGRRVFEQNLQPDPAQVHAGWYLLDHADSALSATLEVVDAQGTHAEHHSRLDGHHARLTTPRRLFRQARVAHAVRAIPAGQDDGPSGLPLPRRSPPSSGQHPPTSYGRR